MSLVKMLFAAAITSTVAGLMSPASAATTGIVVSGIGSTTQIGLHPASNAGPDGGNLLGAGGIEYYIPLSGGNGTYGVSNYGLNADFGNGGPTEKMFLYFSPVSGNSVLTIKFQDLDLVGANDPSGFFEVASNLRSGRKSANARDHKPRVIPQW